MSFTFRVVIAGLVGLFIGAASRWFRIPVPAPPTLLGALLILTITGGYVLVDRYFPPEPHNSSTSSYARSDDSRSSRVATESDSPANNPPEAPAERGE